jgi:predicted nucleic acid-binding protein
MPRPDDAIRAGGATLAFDTNAILGYSKAERRAVFGGFLTMCDAADRLRNEASSPLPIAIVVPSLVRLEGLHDLRVDLGKKPFDASKVVQDLKNKADVTAFDEDAAIKASGALHRWFPSHEAWHAAKRDRCLEVLGLQRAADREQSGLASIDWAIAAQAEAEGWILVTADTGAEFRQVSFKITKTDLRRLLDELLRERGLE